MPRILLIDDDEMCLAITGQLLRSHGYEVLEAQTGNEGRRVARESRPDVVLVDVWLPDAPGIDVLAQLKTDCPDTSRVMFSGHVTLDMAIKGMRLGVCDCLTKPALDEDILAAVKRALARQLHRADVERAEFALPPSEPHAAARWAEPVVRAVEAPHDPRTLSEFGRVVFVSVGCFRNWCRTTRVSSRASLSFARALRAVYRFEQDRSTRPENLLSIVDQRTIVKFVKQCGGDGACLPDSVAQFLECQRFVTNSEAIEAVRRQLLGRERRGIRSVTAQDPRAFIADRNSGLRDQRSRTSS